MTFTQLCHRFRPLIINQNLRLLFSPVILSVCSRAFEPWGKKNLTSDLNVEQLHVGVFVYYLVEFELFDLTLA